MRRSSPYSGTDDIHYADPSGLLANHLQQALKAQFLFHRDVDYVVVGGEVKIADELTAAPRRAAATPRASIRRPRRKIRLFARRNQTLTTITLQNYFRPTRSFPGDRHRQRLRTRSSGEIGKLPVVAILPVRPVARIDENDLVYRTIDAKFNAVADDVAARHEAGSASGLIGTVSIESSERLSPPFGQARHQARDSEREEPRARGPHHRAGRPRRCGDHRDQHGRPWHGHPARR